MYDVVALSLFPLAMILAAFSDLFTMTIPNKISIALVGAFVLLAPFSGMSLQDFAMHSGAGILVFSISLAMFAFGWIGGGDAKLLSATALWMGFANLPSYILLTAVAGGALTLVILFARTVPLPLFLAQYGWIARLHDRGQGVPYGLALAAGGLAVYPSTLWLMHG